MGQNQIKNPRTMLDTLPYGEYGKKWNDPDHKMRSALAFCTVTKKDTD